MGLTVRGKLTLSFPYPIPPPPTPGFELPITQQQKITSCGTPTSNYNFGSAVDITETTLIVGESGYLSDRGRACIFTKSGGTWTTQDTLTASDGAASDRFGASAALSANGDIAVVGAHFQSAGGDDRGAAYVFTRSGETWSQQQKLTQSSAANFDYFGCDVAISADGNTIVVGAFSVGIGGAFFVFEKDGSTWTEVEKITGASGSEFGWCVAISADGNTIITGAPADTSGRGAAWVYTRDAGSPINWSQQQKLVSGLIVTNQTFGRDVDISGDGNTVIVGSVREDGNANPAGRAYVFTRSGETWSTEKILIPSWYTNGDYYGYSVAINDAATTILIGAHLSYGTAEEYAIFRDAGAAFVFEKSGSPIWEEIDVLLQDTRHDEDGFGFSVSLNPLGNEASIGAPFEANGGFEVGSVYTFK